MQDGATAQDGLTLSAQTMGGQQQGASMRHDREKCARGKSSLTKGAPMQCDEQARHGVARCRLLPRCVVADDVEGHSCRDDDRIRP